MPIYRIGRQRWGHGQHIGCTANRERGRAQGHSRQEAERCGRCYGQAKNPKVPQAEQEMRMRVMGAEAWRQESHWMIPILGGDGNGEAQQWAGSLEN